MTKRPRLAKKIQPALRPLHERVLEMGAKISAAGAALAAIGGAYVWLGLPVIATSADIKKLNSSQAEIAVDVYSRDVRDNIIMRNSVKNDPTALKMIDQNLQEAKEKLKAAQDRRIELSK